MSGTGRTLARDRAELPSVLRERAQRMRAIVRDFRLRNGAERILAFADDLDSQAKRYEAPEQNRPVCAVATFNERADNR